MIQTLIELLANMHLQILFVIWLFVFVFYPDIKSYWRNCRGKHVCVFHVVDKTFHSAMNGYDYTRREFPFCIECGALKVVDAADIRKARLREEIIKVTEKIKQEQQRQR